MLDGIHEAVKVKAVPEPERTSGIRENAKPAVTKAIKTTK